ncbi:MAG: hypothetical protein WKG03_06610 [Telluria sp.]
MPTTLVFETGPVQLALRQCESLEQAPVITLQLHAATDPHIYTADGQALAEARWVMTITSGAEPELYSLGYALPGERALCTLLVSQSPDRFATLLDMFKGGNVSEISFDVEGLVALSDYSRQWDTRAAPTLAVSSVCFEFPLPQDE